MAATNEKRKGNPKVTSKKKTKPKPRPTKRDEKLEFNEKIERMKASKAERQMTSQEYRDFQKRVCADCEKGVLSEADRDALLVSEYKRRMHMYRNGGDGIVRWCEENIVLMPPDLITGVRAPYYIGELPDTPDPETGRSWKSLWDHQIPILREAFRMDDNGRLVYSLLVFCTPRGEGKSAWAVWGHGWKFFNFDMQKIFLCANSKDQSTYAHYDELIGYIKISPALLALIGGESRLLAKQLSILDDKRQVNSFIRPSSSHNGIMSGASGFSFSEFFQAAMPTTFFSEIFTSTRNVINAVGIIDTTVSDMEHTLRKLYDKVVNKEKGHERIFFYYESNPEADPDKYHNPLNNRQQLETFEAALGHLPGQFDMLFRNTWESASRDLFDKLDIQAMSYIGVDGNIGNHKGVIDILKTCDDNVKKDDDMRGRGLRTVERPAAAQNPPLMARLIHIDNYITTVFPDDPYTDYVPRDMLEVLGEFYDTDWCIGVGVDRNDPLSTTSAAQTALTCVAKGLPGSKTDPTRFMQGLSDTTVSTDYIYVILSAKVLPRTALTTDVQAIISKWEQEYEAVESFCSDRYNVSDLVGWLKDNTIVDKPEVLHYVYEKQKEVMRIMHECMRTGRLKKPRLADSTVYENSNWDDLLQEQMQYYTHTVAKSGRGVYGSCEKSKGGVQDDCLESLALGIFGMRNLGIKDLRSISEIGSFGSYYGADGY